MSPSCTHYTHDFHWNSKKPGDLKMNKTRVNFTIDPFIYLQFKNRVPERDISKLLERFMKQYVETEGYTSIEETKLREKHTELKEQATNILSELKVIEMQLQTLEEQRKANVIAQREKALEAVNAIKANPILLEEE